MTKIEPSEDFKNCRQGDVVEGRGVFSQARNAIEWDVSTIRIVCPHLKAGDAVRWWQDGDWRHGRVLAVNPDTENKKFWVWVEERGKWPRRTFSADELTRVHSNDQAPVGDEAADREDRGAV